MHQAAVHGELRKKKRNHGVGMDDSDDDSDEDERNRRIRRGMNKKQKIDRDDINALGKYRLPVTRGPTNLVAVSSGKNEETKSFFDVYNDDLVDDDNAELAYLQQSQADTIMTNAVENNDDEEEEDSRGFISREELQRQVREMAAQSEEVRLHHTLDGLPAKRRIAGRSPGP